MAALNAAEEAGERLAEGLRSLRSEGVLCDVALSVGSERCFAHQVVLAAHSRPLREHLVATNKTEAVSCPELKVCPHPQELKLGNCSSDAETVNALLGRIYGNGDGSFEEKADLKELATAFELKNLEAAELAAGFQAMQEEGLLCDILLSAGGERIPAHQAVLASANATLRRLVLDTYKNACRMRAEMRGESKLSEVLSQSMELELQGVESAEALHLLLDFLYGRCLEDRKPSAEACRDVLKLSSELSLQGLQDHGLQWMKECKQVNTFAVPEETEIAAAISQEEVPEVEEEAEAEPEAVQKPKRKAAAKRKAKAAPAEVVEDPPEVDAEPEEEEEAATPVQSPRKKQAASPAKKEKAPTLKFARFNSEAAVPQPLADGAMEAAQAAGMVHGKVEQRILIQMITVFWERPALLKNGLLKAVQGLDEEKMTRFLPFVTYQWKDGPWQTAYCRLGWDPRENAEEAKMFQVFEFKDPALKSQPKGENDEGNGDIFFREPPTAKCQKYQLEDIEDEFVQELVGGCEVADECDRRYGFVADFIIHTVHDRLTIKSKEMREKAALKQSRGSAKRRTSAAGKAQAKKRART